MKVRQELGEAYDSEQQKYIDLPIDSIQEAAENK